MADSLFKIELYQFEKLSKALDRWGYPQVSFKSGFQVIKGLDFEEAFKAGNIRFEDDGIYLDYDDKSLKGYMFIREPYIEVHNSYPKFHIVKCQKINDFILKGNFKDRYDFSNSEVNDLTDKTSRKLYKDEKLSLCAYCRKQVRSEIKTTQDFFDLLEEEYKVDDINVDLFGYTQGWESISRAFKTRKEYSCEDCGIQITKVLDKRFIHTHHVSGDKTDNSEKNLKCLCILCHSNQDENHRQNFQKGSMKKELDIFISNYKAHLAKAGNKYLK
jgi:hypothetical protein